MQHKEERYKDIVEEFKELLPDFYAEVDIYPEMPEPDIDHDALCYAEDMQVITARYDNKLVGIHTTLVKKDIFYKTILTGYVLFYYMLPAFRGKGKGLDMFRYAESLCKQKGVGRMFMSRKIYIMNGKLFDTLGYTQIEANYTKAML